MDTTTVLDKYTHDLLNLPLEVKHLLQELKNKDVQLQETRRKWQTKDLQLHKFIRANGTLTRHPKEPQLQARIEEEMRAVERLQRDKILLANTALFLISKHLCNFETDVAKLERDGLLPAVENVMALDAALLAAGAARDAYALGSLTPRPESHAAGAAPAGAVAHAAAQRRLQKRKQSRPPAPKRRFDDDAYAFELPNALHVGLGLAMHEAPGFGDFHPGDDADNNLYCFCQRVSFGEMIGCDNDDCKYEWFHWACVGITSPPKDDEIWYCPDCLPKMEKRKKKRRS